MSKGEIDYAAYRAVGHKLTPEEKDYLTRDCMIVAQALKIQFEQGLNKMTNASDAMDAYKKSVGGNFDRWFPQLPLELDNNIRKAYTCTSHINHKALAYYKRMGFAEEGRLKEHFNRGIDEIQLGKFYN